MIKIDVSRAIPPRLGTYLLGIIPGMFFEVSVAIGDPHLAASVVSRVREIYPFGPYALIVLFLASCLLAGRVFRRCWISDLLIAPHLRCGDTQYGGRLGLMAFRRFAKLRGIPPEQNTFIHL